MGVKVVARDASRWNAVGDRFTAMATLTCINSRHQNFRGVRRRFSAMTGSATHTAMTAMVEMRLREPLVL